MHKSSIKPQHTNGSKRTTSHHKTLTQQQTKTKLLTKRKLKKIITPLHKTFSTTTTKPLLKTTTTTTTNTPQPVQPTQEQIKKQLEQQQEQDNTPFVTTTVTNPDAVSFENALNETMVEVKRNMPYYIPQISLFPPRQRPLAFGLRSLVCELDAIPEKSTRPDIMMLKATFWRSSAEKMRIVILHEMLSRQYAPDSPEMLYFMRDVTSIEPPAPLAPIKTMMTAIANEGMGFDFDLLDNLITNHADYYQGHTFPTLTDYIRTVDQTCGNLNTLLVTVAAHEIQQLEEVKPLSKPLINATLQLGRVEGLFRLLSHQPLTFAQNHTWLPRDLLQKTGSDPTHFATIGKELLQYSNKEWFEGFSKNNFPNSIISPNISNEFQDDSGEQQLEQDLHFMRSADPNRRDEGLASTTPAHLQNIEKITMHQLRTSLRETNKVIHDITREQLTKLRSMQSDVPKQLRPYFFQAAITETYLDALKEADYDTLDPELHIWSPKQLLKLNAKFLWGNTIGRF